MTIDMFASCRRISYMTDFRNCPFTQHCPEHSVSSYIEVENLVSGSKFPFGDNFFTLFLSCDSKEKDTKCGY
jgi:hypothetical protein